jgi:hypothetical protein
MWHIEARPMKITHLLLILGAIVALSAIGLYIWISVMLGSPIRPGDLF